MNDKITGCVVQFDPSLPEEEKKLLIGAIQRFSGIKNISLQYYVLPGLEVDLDPPQPEKTIPRPGMLPPDEHRRVPQPNRSNPDITDQNQQRSGAIPTESDYQQQRHLIDIAIKWGIKNKKINWESIQGLSPEQIVTTAFDLIKQMPEREMKKIEVLISKNIQ